MFLLPVTAQETLARPIKSTLPETGPCGRREREVEAGYGAEQSGRSACIATVEGALVFGMAVPFAGPRWNAGLGRSDASLGVPPLSGVAPATAGARR